MTTVAEPTPEIRNVVATVRGVAPLSWSRYYQDDDDLARGDKESPGEYEKRTWMHRFHTNGNGNVIIPGMAFKRCLDNVAPFLGEKIKGRGQATWTKHFLSGILVTDDCDLGIPLKDVSPKWLFVPSDGKKGGAKRVNKCFPVIQEWKVEVHFLVLDPLINQSVFERHLREAGKYIGLGFFRPERGGYWGRFEVPKLDWS